MPSVPPRRGVLRFAFAAGLLMAGAGCSALDVSDPTKVSEESLDNATGADILRRRALYSLDMGEPNAAWIGGLVADEFTVHPSYVGQSYQLIDYRFKNENEVEGTYYYMNTPYQYRLKTRYQATLALQKIAAFGQTTTRDEFMGQMYAVRAYATLRLAEDFCGGYPLHELNGYSPVYSGPKLPSEVFERALADADSAKPLVGDTARIQNFARVVRARILLGMGRQAEAATEVANVPTSFVLDNESGGNYVSFYGSAYQGETVADQDGGNGMDFVSANDPRVQVTQMGVASDDVTPLYTANRYMNSTDKIVLASGIEARLIEAEAAVVAGQPEWRTKLNELRTSCTDAGTCPTPAPAGTGGVAGLPLLADPGSDEARLDLVIRERAFWLYGTGHRLGDLRRLVGVYERDPETVFPAGAGYGTSQSMPFPYPENERTFSPAVNKCTTP